MTYPVPRSHYLFVHDALRRAFGKENVELSAFVKNKFPFQCDMLVNAPETDPEVLRGDRAKVGDIVKRLQRDLGNCTLRAQEQRIDIIFRDHNTLRLALGAPRSRLNNLRETKDINGEPDWRKRNRLRISLGFDEYLFTSSCSLGINLASRALEKYCYDYYKRSPLLSLLPGNIRERFEADYHDVIPPVTYWQAHCYALSAAYPVYNYDQLESTVWKNFALYFNKYPFDNPYCAGEDLNTLASAKLLCSIWQQAPISSDQDYQEAALGTKPADNEEGSGGEATASTSPAGGDDGLKR